MTTIQQKERYEAAYANRKSEYGIPDRKITAGHDASGLRILCLGCGAGYDVWYLCEANQVVGLDYANSGLEAARQHGIEVVSGDLNFSPSLPLPDDSFDIVVCKDILEHLLDPLSVLREVRRVLKSSGYCVISVPNHFYFPIRIKSLLGLGLMFDSAHAQENREWDYMHIRFFTFKGFKEFLREAGFAPARWFWDFGKLAHYHQPDMWIEPQQWKEKNGISISKRAAITLTYLYPLWRVFNLLFPSRLRAWMVGLSPGLLCSGFYVHAVKSSSRE